MKMVNFALRNQGYKTIQDYEMIFNTKIMASSTFFKIAKIILERGIEDCEESLRRAREVLH